MESTPYTFDYYFDESVRAVQRNNGVLDSFQMPIYVWKHDQANMPKYPPLGSTGNLLNERLRKHEVYTVLMLLHLQGQIAKRSLI